MLQNFTLLSRAITLPYNGKSSFWHFRVTQKGEIIKIAIRGSMLLIQNCDINDLNSEVIRQLEESEECSPEEVQLMMELAKEQLLKGELFATDIEEDTELEVPGAIHVPVIHDDQPRHHHSLAHTLTTFAHDLIHSFNPLHQR